jgi:hypothetical protein
MSKNPTHVNLVLTFQQDVQILNTTSYFHHFELFLTHFHHFELFSTHVKHLNTRSRSSSVAVLPYGTVANHLIKSSGGIAHYLYPPFIYPQYYPLNNPYDINFPLEEPIFPFRYLQCNN